MFEIGNTLREARVRRNLTLQQVEEDTKIRVKYLQAMENEDFDLMPGATYAKAFLRTYSNYLGLDANVIIQEYISRGAPFRELEPFGGSSIIGAPRRHRGRNTVVFVAVICLLVLAVFYVLGLGDNGNETPVTKSSALGIATPSAKASTSASPLASASASPSTTATPAARSEVRISASQGDCWLEVRVQNSSGRVLYSALLAKGKTKVFYGKKLWFRLGAPGMVLMRAGDKRVKPETDVGPLDIQIINGQVLQGSAIQGG